MPFSVSRSDTGQFVLQDPRTQTVIVEDDLLAGLEKLEAATAGKAGPSGVTGVSTGNEGDSAFGFRGSRYALVLLAAILPFVWLGLLYFALANLLSEQALGRGEQRALEDRVHTLESEIAALRAEAASAPRLNKTKPRRRSEDNPTLEPRTKLDTAEDAAKAKAEGGEAKASAAESGP